MEGPIVAKQKRDNDYLLGLLERTHPTIFADLKAGKFRSPRQALIAAGLRQPTKPLNTLKAAWLKATPAEQAEFRKWIGAAAAMGPSKRMPSFASVSSIVGPDGRLLPQIKARIEHLMANRGLGQGEVLHEMGIHTPHDASLGMALSKGRPSKVREELQRGLVKWLDDHKSVP